jgi:uncharacterized protein YbbC (DUF1343 family)
MTSRSRALALVLALAPTLLPAQTRPAAGGVIPGIEVLLKDSLHLIKGKRVGLLTNHSGRDRKGTSTIDLLFKAPGVKLTALFGPEHGLRGVAKAGEKIASSVDSATGVPIYSLYGTVSVPTPEMLKDVDVLLYDIQDVGARVYTFQWTLANMAASAGKTVIILDRPDPIRADRFEGNILDPKFASLVGQYPVALRYGLTPGELMLYLVKSGQLKADIKVVPMQGYKRSMWFDETGIPRVNPSPNLRTPDSELLYPGTVLFEGTTATEGRGTDDPFTIIGAEWLTDAGVVAKRLNALKLPGVRFDSTSRTIEPTYKFGGKTIPMIKITVTDRDRVRPVELGLHMLQEVRRGHEKDFQWRVASIDRLSGTDKVRAAIEANTLDALIAEWNADATKFARLVRATQIYR